MSNDDISFIICMLLLFLVPYVLGALLGLLSAIGGY